MLLNEIKDLAYDEKGSEQLSVVDAYLYDREAAIYKMFRHGFINESTAKKQIIAAENDYKALKLLNDCFLKTMEQHRILEHLKCEYNETHSSETAHKIAKMLITENSGAEVQNG